MNLNWLILLITEPLKVEEIPATEIQFSVLTEALRCHLRLRTIKDPRDFLLASKEVFTRTYKNYEVLGDLATSVLLSRPGGAKYAEKILHELDDVTACLLVADGLLDRLNSG